MLLFLLNIRLFKVDRERNMAAGAIDNRVSVEGPNIVFRALTAEFMVTTRPDRFLGRLITDIAHQNILAILGVLLQNEIRMVRHLTHLHDKSKNIGVVIEHHTPAHVSIKLPSRVRHDASREVTFNVSKKLVMQNHPRQR